MERKQQQQKKHIATFNNRAHNRKSPRDKFIFLPEFPGVYSSCESEERVFVIKTEGALESSKTVSLPGRSGGKSHASSLTSRQEKGSSGFEASLSRVKFEALEAFL